MFRIQVLLNYDNNLFPDYEASFIRLLDKITNGSIIVVSETGMYNNTL